MDNFQIPISENGTTTLATAGKYCDRNIDVIVNVPVADDRYEEGRQAAVDAFWEEYQDYGKRRDYQYAFAYFSDEFFDPKYPVITNNAAYLVNRATITNLKVEVDCSGATSMSNVFYNAQQ